MIRFVDLSDSDTGYGFAFFDTVTDKFVEINDEQAWDNLSDFMENIDSSYDVHRFVVLIPDKFCNED